jgi:hypothetical protein
VRRAGVWTAYEALKLVAIGGPVAMAFSVAGSALLGVAIFDKAGEHYDALVVLGVTATVLGFVEWALARRFRAHESVERTLYAELGMTADTAAATAVEAVRNLKELRRELKVEEEMGKNLAAEVEILERRVGYLEERVGRATVLGSRRPPEGT